MRGRVTPTNPNGSSYRSIVGHFRPGTMERIMKISLAVVSAVLAVGTAVPAFAGVNDPEVIIYRFPGVFDSGHATNIGVATTFHCTNFSGATENVRFVTRAFNGDLLSNVASNIAHLSTMTASTHGTTMYTDQSPNLNTGIVNQGTTAIAATSINVI